jgi:hypothetical protein
MLQSEGAEVVLAHLAALDEDCRRAGDSGPNSASEVAPYRL